MKKDKLINSTLIIGIINIVMFLSTIFLMFSPLGHKPGQMHFIIVPFFIYSVFFSGILAFIAIIIIIIILLRKYKNQYLVLSIVINSFYLCMYIACMYFIIIGGMSV
ncbi:MAG: hypothetical protein FH751_14680 [Firmicutes bacterium]|nr:hypothetical protein [Bacillota bacterium]